MGSMQPLKRIYQGPDVEMKDEALGIYNSFLEDQPVFIQFDPDFGKPEFAPGFLKLIHDADNIQSIALRNTNLKALTVIVNNKMEQCQKKFQGSKYFIEKAFPDNPIISDEFGYHRYEKARKNQLLMKEFMRDFHYTAVKYSSNLIAVNYTQEMIDEIDTYRQELVQADGDQEDFKRGRPTVTQDNVKILNACYSMTAKVAGVGKQIFADDYAKHKRYVLNTEPEAEQETETQAAPENPA